MAAPGKWRKKISSVILHAPGCLGGIFINCAILCRMNSPASALSHLQCPECGKIFKADEVQTFCLDCRSPLLARYELDAARKTLTPQAVSARPRGIWRWGEILPVRAPAHRLTLGEGDTPLLKAGNLAKTLRLSELYIKNESANQTGSLKARGLAIAVSRALELGVREFAGSSTGNGGGALAAYAARGRARAHVYMPKDAPTPCQVEVKVSGAELLLVDGLLPEAAKLAGEAAQKHGWRDLSAFKEPYGCEGQKTIGLELAEAFGWSLPDVILYPTGDSLGLAGMWKAFAELEELGLIGAGRPRLVCVQAEGCAPLVRAFSENKARAVAWDGAQTIATGLRVPEVFADRLILRAIRESHGAALSVSDEEILSCQKELAESEGILAAPEGAATLAALKHLQAAGWLKSDERIVLMNTGFGLKNLQP
jgi:threonine synthase